MDLLEYQAKELFREMGIPVLPSQRIDSPREIKDLRIPYPVVLKSQVRSGGRAKAGGIRFVANTIDAIAAARTIFNLSIAGEYPQVLLAEAKYNAEREIYLAVALDYTICRPVLLGSSTGGIDLEAVNAQMQQVVVEGEFSPFLARRLAIAMGLQGNLIQSASAAIEKMYQLLVQKDLDLVEINPLAVSSDGELMALDGKIIANDAALERHPELAALQRQTSNIVEPNSFLSFRQLERDGNISLLCNDATLALALADMLVHAGGKPAQCLTLNWQASCQMEAAGRREQLGRAIDKLMQDKNTKVLLVNLLAYPSEPTSSCYAEAAEVLLEKCKAQEVAALTAPAVRRAAYPQVILRLVGGEIVGEPEQPAALPVRWVSELNEAIAQAVARAKKSQPNTK